MNLTKKNFYQELPYIKKCLIKSHLIAIDFEMTGMLSMNNLRNSNQDTLELRYWKARANSKDFLPIQIGVCGFELEQTPNYTKYTSIYSKS